MSIEEGNVLLNYAKSFGGAAFLGHCQASFDHVTFANNTAGISGGAINSESSMIDIHNCKAEHNSAEEKGTFAMISSKSKLKTYYLTLTSIKRNSVVITESSSAELRHVHLAKRSDYCSITAFVDSHINLVTIYSQLEAYRTSDKRKIVCVDSSSTTEGTPTGVLLI